MAFNNLSLEKHCARERFLKSKEFKSKSLTAFSRVPKSVRNSENPCMLFIFVCSPLLGFFGSTVLSF